MVTTYSEKLLEQGLLHGKRSTVLRLMKGKFGRVLGDFIIEGKPVSEIMCKAGHAVPYFGGAKADTQKQHMTNRKRFVAEGVVKGAIE